MQLRLEKDVIKGNIKAGFLCLEMQLECLVQISHFIGDFQNISLNNKKMNIESICKLTSFVAEQRPLSNLLLSHVWDGLLINPNYTVLLCLIVSALAGIKTKAHCCICWHCPDLLGPDPAKWGSSHSISGVPVGMVMG